MRHDDAGDGDTFVTGRETKIKNKFCHFKKY